MNRLQRLRKPQRKALMENPPSEPFFLPEKRKINGGMYESGSICACFNRTRGTDQCTGKPAGMV